MDIEQRVEKNKVYDDLETSGSDIEIVKVEKRASKSNKRAQWMTLTLVQAKRKISLKNPSKSKKR